MKLYFKFMSIHFRSAMTYRASFFLSCLGHLLITGNVFIGVIFMMRRFDSVGGYTLPQLSLCYAVILAGTSLAECFARGIDAFGRILSEAQFDRIMLRPRSLLFQVLCQDMKPTMLARVLQAVIMLAWAIGSGAVDWTFRKAVTLALMIMCGAAVFFGIYLINACITFFTLEHVEAINIFMDGPREYGKYPFGIYGKPVLVILTVLVPLALVQHWPLQYLFDRGPAWYGLLPVVSLVFLIPCALLWRLGVRHYRSTGS